MKRRSAMLCLATITAVAATAPTAQASTVCNEAENSRRGGYVVSGGPVDPSPPAFLRGSQMRVGRVTASAGLERAAEHSPALRTCGPVDPDTGPTNPDDEITAN